MGLVEEETVAGGPCNSLFSAAEHPGPCTELLELVALSSHLKWPVWTGLKEVTALKPQ